MRIPAVIEIFSIDDGALDAHPRPDADKRLTGPSKLYSILNAVIRAQNYVR
jgi:hypothetical protein